MTITAIIQALIFYVGLIATPILGILSFLANFNAFGIILVMLICLTGPCGVLIQRRVDYKHAQRR